MNTTSPSAAIITFDRLAPSHAPALRAFVLSIMVLTGSWCAAEDVRLDVNDVSFLWPVPVTVEQADALISLKDLAADGDLVSDTVFNQLMAEAKKVQVKDKKIGFAVGVADNKSAWKVAGIRINPSAFGSNPDVLAKTGEAPSLRLIVQPVTTAGGKVKLHDTAAHVVFSYLKGFDGQKAIPDKDAFSSMVNDLLQLKSELKAAGVETSGMKLVDHPGFGNPDLHLTDKLRALLKKHTHSQRLSVVSFMGVPVAFEPWLFFAVVVKKDGGIVSLEDRPVNGHFAQPATSQMMDFRAGGEIVPMSVRDPQATDKSFGISTALLFGDSVDLEETLLPGMTQEPFASWKMKDVPDLIANPTLIFNTASMDCASCHSETTRRLNVPGLNKPSKFQYQLPLGISGVDESMLHEDTWNVRNFGWGFNFTTNPGFHPTVTQRAANEAADSANFINKNYLPAPDASAGSK